MKLKRWQRILTLLYCCIIIFLFFSFRLAYLQIARGKILARDAVRQRAHVVTLDYNRGDIRDRNGVSLLGGEKEKVLVLFPGLLAKGNPEMLEVVSSLVPASSLSEKPSIALRKLSEHEEKLFKELQCSGVVVAEAQKRYGLQALATHVVGHVGPEDGEGKVGLELTFNKELSGSVPHALAAVVDGKNNLIEGLGFRLWGASAPYRPYNLVLTIDSNIQKKVEDIMDRRVKRGAAIVINPQNGDILAMASRPNYFQANLSDYMRNAENNASFFEAQPFINRSILSYPPGSVFKIVVAAAALESGNYSPDSTFYCPGSVQIGDRLFRCHQNKAHGYITLAQAFAHSCNTTFIELAMKLGRKTIYDYALKLGLGQITGIPLGSSVQGGETAGYIPSPQEMPYLGDLALTAIGQGRVEATPLQVACLTSAAVNGGYLIKPRLAGALQTQDGDEIKKFPAGEKTRVLSPLTAAQIRFMMLGVVEYGTGKGASNNKLLLGGKSGTAETGRLFNGKPQQYSWFSGFWAKGENKAVITVFVEEATRGSAAELFGTIAKEIEPELTHSP